MLFALPTSESVDPDRPRNAKGHRPDCVCTLCARIQARIAAGKPPKKVARAMASDLAHQRRLDRSKDKRFGTTARNKREQRIAKNAMLTGAVVAQAATGARPNIAQAAKIAGMDPSQAQRQINRDGTVQEALERNGITLELLDQVGKDGLKADSLKLIYDEKGNVVDSIAVPDQHARHKYWRDFNMMYGRLGSERESGAGGGGLIIIAPEDAKVVDGHPPVCTCDECIAMWNEKTKHIAAKAARQMAVDAEIVEQPKPLPESFDAPEDDFKTDDFSDRDDE